MPASVRANFNQEVLRRRTFLYYAGREIRQITEELQAISYEFGLKSPALSGMPSGSCDGSDLSGYIIRVETIQRQREEKREKQVIMIRLAMIMYRLVNDKDIHCYLFQTTPLCTEERARERSLFRYKKIPAGTNERSTKHKRKSEKKTPDEACMVIAWSLMRLRS